MLMLLCTKINCELIAFTTCVYVLATVIFTYHILYRYIEISELIFKPSRISTKDRVDKSQTGIYDLIRKIF